MKRRLFSVVLPKQQMWHKMSLAMLGVSSRASFKQPQQMPHKDYDLFWFYFCVFQIKPPTAAMSFLKFCEYKQDIIPTIQWGSQWIKEDFSYSKALEAKVIHRKTKSTVWTKYCLWKSTYLSTSDICTSNSNDIYLKVTVITYIHLWCDLDITCFVKANNHSQLVCLWFKN